MKFKYHLALSFSGAWRSEARALAERLRDSGYNVFFDEWYEHEMLGLNGADYLRHVYARDARHCIVLIDKTYDAREWTSFEREIIEARTLQEPKDVLIPVLLDGHRPDWLPRTRIYCDYREKGLEGTVTLVVRKLPLYSGGVPVLFAPPDGFTHDLVISKKGGTQEPRVLLINAGGTVGLFSEDQLQRGRPAQWSDLHTLLPGIDHLEFGVDMVTFFPHIDAENVGPDHWRAIANTIAVHYQEHIGFVVLHGSDTLSYTASALSFALANLEKPVVLTYSQLPPFQKRTDASSNILCSLLVAGGAATGLPLVPEVCILSRDVLLRGNRAKKIDAMSFDAFSSPSFPPLGRLGECVTINRDLVRTLPQNRFYVDSTLSSGVIVLSLFPGVKADFLQRVVFDHDETGSSICGILFETFGAGNIPQDSNFLDFLNKCRAQKIPVVMASRVDGSAIFGLYPAERWAMDLGVISALDMTREATLCKLAWLLGRKVPYEDMGAFLQNDCRGELTQELARTVAHQQQNAVGGPPHRR